MEIDIIENCKEHYELLSDKEPNSHESIDLYHQWYDAARLLFDEWIDSNDPDLIKFCSVDNSGNGYVLRRNFDDIRASYSVLVKRIQNMGSKTVTINKLKTMKETNQKRCFFITPIGEEGSEVNKRMKEVVGIIKPAIESLGYTFVMPNERMPGSITCFIFRHLFEDEIVVADLSGLNPNVMYELGVRHTIGKPVVVICEKGTILPFDTKDDRTVFYENSFSGSDALKVELRDMIDGTTENPVSNPVINAMKINNCEWIPKDEILRVVKEHERDNFLTSEEINEIIKS